MIFFIIMNHIETPGKGGNRFSGKKGLGFYAGSEKGKE